MGGGRRTFPGGLNKWQWKRLHEKKAREKERKLLDHERQLYQARLRSHIRAKMLGGADGRPPPQAEQFGAAMTPQEHVKALADRFTKPGAEDLWNEDDGPLTEPEHRRPAPAITEGERQQRRLLSDIDLQGLVPGRRRLGANICSIGSTELGGRKSYHSRSQSGESANLGILFSSVENGLLLLKGHRCYAVEAGRVARSKNRFRMSQNSSSDEEEEDESGMEDMEENESEGGLVVSEKRRAAKEMMSSTALLKHDRKKERRFTRQFYDEEDLSAQVCRIREEFKMRNSFTEEDKEEEDEEEHIGEEDSLLSDNRYLL